MATETRVVAPADEAGQWVLTRPYGSWLNLGSRGIFLDLRRKIRSYLNPADLLLVEFAHFPKTDDWLIDECAQRCYHDKFAAASCQCTWVRVCAECARYGYFDAVLWFVYKFPRAYAPHKCSTEILYKAAIGCQVNLLDSIEHVIRPNIYIRKEPSFIGRIIDGGANLATVKWFRERGEVWHYTNYANALLRGRYDIAEFIKSEYRVCACGRSAVTSPTHEIRVASHNSQNETYIAHAVSDEQNHQCDLHLGLSKRSTGYVNGSLYISTTNWWSYVLADLNLGAAQYYWKHGGNDNLISSLRGSIILWFYASNLCREKVLNMTEWLAGKISLARLEILYKIAAGFCGRDSTTNMIRTREVDMNLVKHLYRVGVEIAPVLPLLAGLSQELYVWCKSLPEFEHLAVMDILLSKWTTDEMLSRILQEYDVVITHELLTRILDTKNYDLFDVIYKKFRARSHNQ